MDDQEDSLPLIQFRSAKLADVPLLEHWQAQPHVIEAGIEDWPWHEELQEHPPWREQLIAELDGRAIGFVQIIDPYLETTHYWGTIDPRMRAVDIWIGEAEDLGNGYGTTMMKLALKKCFSAPDVSAVIIDPLESNKRAQRFYQRLGFEFCENRYFDDDFCSIFKLTRSVWTALVSDTPRF